MKAYVALLALVLLVTACAKEPAPAGPDVVVPTLVEPPVEAAQLENDLTGLDTLETDLDLSELDSLDRDLNLG